MSHGRRKSNERHFRRTYGTQFRLSEPEAEASTQQEDKADRTETVRTRTRKSKSALPASKNSSHLEGLVSDTLKNQLETNIMAKKHQDIDYFQNGTSGPPQGFETEVLRHRSPSGKPQTSKKLHQKSVTVKQKSQFTLEHNPQRLFDKKLAASSHREGSRVGQRRQRNPVVKDAFRSQFQIC